MSHVNNAPRQYKFVSGYPRKRRRQTAPKDARDRGATGQGTVVRPVNEEQAQPACITAPPAASSLPRLHSENVAAQSTSEGTTVDNGLGILPPSPQAGIDISALDEVAGWRCEGLGTSQRPVLDISATSCAPIDQLLFLDPGNETWDTLLNPPSNGDLPHCDDDGEDEREGATVVENETGGFSALQTLNEIAWPSLNLSSGPCNIRNTVSQLFVRYDKEYCVMPLTHDFAANPFRFNGETIRCSQLLRHCILALAYNHVNRDTGACWNESKMHKEKALQMMNDLESDSHTSRLRTEPLYALLVLMTLDCATSAHGPWVWYLKRAHKIIQAAVSLGSHKSLRMKAGIEMLVWRDVTLALTSRQGCNLSESVIMDVVNSAGTDRRTFYSVSGCPETLLRHMVRLGSYARELELTATMVCARFDMAPVLAVEKSIRDWTDPEYDDLGNGLLGNLCTEVDETGDHLHYKEDLHHCAEAWRYCLLLYIERVFKWPRHQPPSPILGFLARKILNHVTSCRRSTLVQKQLLLPVMLAGCETKDENLRQEARQYCSWWNEKTRYGMFHTTSGLLEEVWATGNDDPLAWWGSIMDRKSRDDDVNAPDFRQYLFG